MMIKKKSNPWARLKYVYVLPLAAVAVAAFARPEVSNEFAEISNAKVNDLTSIVKTEEVKSVKKSLDKKFNLSGQVMEYESKKPVPGASVVIKGTTMGTLTDKEGKFTLSVKKGDVLVVSYVGLQTQSVPIEADTELVIWTRDDVQSMNEMVVTGYAPEEKEQPVKQEETKIQPQEEVIFQVVEEMPQFPGGMAEAMKFLAKNIKYPVAAQQAKIEGRVIVQFVVERDGSISDVHAMRGVNPDLDAEAIRVVSLMPKWKPGKQRGKAVAVKYTMPIMFRLQSPEPKKEEAAPFHQITLKVDKDADKGNVDAIKEFFKNRNSKGTCIETTLLLGDNRKNNVIWLRGADAKSPLIVVDGKILGNGMDVLKLTPIDQIESMSVLKNKDAIATYGDKAKDGAIVVETKKTSKNK